MTTTVTLSSANVTWTTEVTDRQLEQINWTPYTFPATTTGSTTNTITFGNNTNTSWRLLQPGEVLAPTTPWSPFPAVVIKRAERLLRHRLTSQQARCWLRNRHFFVPSPSDDRILYRVQEQGMIRVYRDGRPEKDLCIHGCEDLPTPDKVVGLLLLIQHEEAELLRVANVHSVPKTVLQAYERLALRVAA
jgi:hypothetical protein